MRIALWGNTPLISTGEGEQARHISCKSNSDARSFRHASDPESLRQFFDIFRSTIWRQVLDSGNA